ncbi:MAG: hypothetical protein AAF203_02080 [Pseudomonadota bacterium]
MVSTTTVGWLGGFLWTWALVLFIFWTPHRWIDRFRRFLLPLCFFILLALFARTVHSVNDYSGFKVLLYPNFSALSSSSLLFALGHSLASLFVGYGFFQDRFLKLREGDLIDIFVLAILQCLTGAILAGAMILPMVQQISEFPIGTSWLFEILPRWMSYGPYGDYYSCLFFGVLSILSVQLVYQLGQLIPASFKPSIRKFFAKKNLLPLSFFVFVQTGLMVIYGNQLSSWGGQYWLLKFDHFLFNGVMSLIALSLVGLLFTVTNQKERREIFARQQIFFHSRVFFRIWELVTLFVVPSLILLAWGLFFFRGS